MQAITWRRGQASVVGQLVEWEVWVELVVRSEGRLHVFLPMLDRGVDGLVHRLDDGRWIPVQVKGGPFFAMDRCRSRFRWVRWWTLTRS